MADTNVIPAESWNIVSSHLLHLDPDTGTPVLDGKARFDSPIIGVISIAVAKGGRPHADHEAPGPVASTTGAPVPVRLRWPP